MTTLEQIKTTKEYLDNHDIMRLFDVGINKADNIIRAIHEVGGNALGKGKVLFSEYLKWRDT